MALGVSPGITATALARHSWRGKRDRGDAANRAHGSSRHSRRCEQSFHPHHQSVPHFDGFWGANFDCVAAAKPLLADPHGRSEVQQRFDHQVVSAILLAQSVVIIDPQMRLKHLIQCVHCRRFSRLGNKDGFDRATLNVELCHLIFFRDSVGGDILNTERWGDTSIIAGGRTRLVKAITKAKRKFENGKKTAFQQRSRC